MKKVLIIFLVLFITSIFANAQNCKAKVTIESGGESLLIFIDEQLAGKGKIETELGNGNHVIKISEPEITWDAKSLTKEIVIENCDKDYSFSLSFEENIVLKTEPYDVAVYENNNLLGKTPLLISKKVERIKLEKESYSPKVLTASEISSHNPVKLEFTGETKGTSFVDSPYFKILIGTAVGLGGLAAYYKIEADKSFEKYDLTKQQKYLDDTDRYDNLSGIAFGVLQVNFGALIYFLLSD